jgi:hypothetical protein
MAKYAAIRQLALLAIGVTFAIGVQLYLGYVDAERHSVADFPCNLPKSEALAVAPDLYDTVCGR